MDTLKNLYRIGHGPSSSHTMAPRRAAEVFVADQPGATSIRVTLYGSLAATGRGHLTDVAIREVLAPRPVEFVWKTGEELPDHPKGMIFEALDASGVVTAAQTFFSVGGGALLGDKEAREVYPLSTVEKILEHCESSGQSFWEYVESCEGKEIWPFLETVWAAMCSALETGLRTPGTLPGALGLTRKAGSFHRKAALLNAELRAEALLAAYAYAVAEQNAAGGVVVTAPTCGSCGILPAILYRLRDAYHVDKADILRALATASLFGNLAKTNASISGAEVGCQGEIGVACAMAAAAATQLLGGTPSQIEYAAEMGLEHHLGLTCDPVAGLVQIPCIERNAHAAVRSLSCARFAFLSDGQHHISFDDVVSVMSETGRALSSLYRETAAGGLAKIYKRHITKALPPT
ncbi:MAG: L-serine ammonia-lyase, iron-sulfur-dependent, subunit alpha [Phycisphaerae bacterium]|nr:L-serine ammonia-lyase, iron-sulfur-dependent, subunit alpha [Phycisphaerae bacterium]